MPYDRQRQCGVGSQDIPGVWMSSGGVGLRDVFPGPRRWPRRSRCGSLGIRAGCRPGGWPVAAGPRCARTPWRAGVVEGTSTGRDPERAEGLEHQRVDEPVVAYEPGLDDLLLAGGAGDRGGAGVVVAVLGGGVAV